jgi:hypothetical protein
MPSIFNERVIVHPSFIEPDLIITTAQPSGFMDILGGRALRVKLGPVDKYIYQNRIDLRTQVAVSQASFNALPSATITADYASTATYLGQVRAEYTEIDVQEAGEWNVALPQAQRLAMRQGIFQYLRLACLYGVNAGNIEGIINTPNSTAVNMPPDSYGNATLPTYDAGQLAIWFLGQIQAALQRMYLLGTKARVVILGPQRIIGQMQLQNIVQLTSYQRPGAGSATTAEVIKKVCQENGYDVEWAYDDTLIGKGSGSTSMNPVDAVLLVVPEVIVPSMQGINTNEFATLSPSEKALTMQYADVGVPVEVTTPIVDGLNVTSRMRFSSGWAPRGECLTVASIPY